MTAAFRPLLMLLFVFQLGCEQPPATTQPEPKPQSLPTTQMKIGDRLYTLEIADEEQERQVGLMHRDSMPADHGMIFVFPGEQPLSFWMRNTRIPLDIIYLDRNGTVISMHRMEPFDLRSTPSARPAKYAIELNAGQIAVNGVKRGDTLNLPLAARDAKDSPR